MRSTRELAENSTGIFAEAAEAMLEINSRFEYVSMKIESFNEATEREFNINLARCELKCMKENGTSDDLAYLEDSAAEGAIGKIKKMIDAIIQKWKEFCTRIRNKVVASIVSSESRNALKKAETKVKLNPLWKTKKIEIHNPKQPMKVIDKYVKDVDKAIARTVKSLGGEKEMSTLADMKENFRTEFKSALTSRAALMSTTIAAVMATLNAELDKLPAYLADFENAHSSVLEKLADNVSGEAAVSAQTALNSAANFRSELMKEQVNCHIDYIMDMMKAVKGKLAEAKGLEKFKPVKESADDFDFDDDDAFEESVDLDSIFDSVDDLLGEY